jgi:hypothetical protein
LQTVTHTEYFNVGMIYVYTKFPISRYKQWILNIVRAQRSDATTWLLRHGLLGHAIINLYVLCCDILFKFSQVTDSKY